MGSRTPQLPIRAHTRYCAVVDARGTKRDAMVHVKRVYAPPAPDDGVRVLVDRLWPRGLCRTTAAIDLWLKDIAPSVTLRRWFNDNRTRWTEFTRRYAEELDTKAASVAALMG